MFDGDTIVAAATLSGHSALGVIRLSGKAAIDIADMAFRSRKGKLSDCQSNTANYGFFKYNDQTIDECIFTIFRSPASYTGEDMVEISHHGSPYIQQQILLSLTALGARAATEGEFTKRAFLNGKMNLSQAEAVADLISAESRIAHDLALKQLRGGYNDELKTLRADLLTLSSLLELELDFSEEDVTFADRLQLRSSLLTIQQQIGGLLSTFALGNAFKQGIAVAIAGKPNSGKSTLLNVLLNENRAIVSEIAGTTRDTIEESINIDGFAFRFIDTAGLRQDSNNAIEQEGIERSYKAIAKAQVVIYLFDASTATPESVNAEIEALKKNVDFNDKHLIIAGNKCDKLPCENEVKPQRIIISDARNETSFYISAVRKQNIEVLKDSLLSFARATDIENKIVITNVRHYQAMQQAFQSVSAALEAFDNKIATDLVAADIRHVLYHIGQITGEISNDEILTNIFSHFCIGK
ncbi:MAG: tRNA uridine-5-carboxymethylaminomethyl(34) synthesis GTPase MnmE [Bacteroidales bacterium]|jgi:tRNA modification GTPase|nr:tRNA uridine-5-carboxymethylaminomethyl(34) synthesis GTPase MnmE [Bacteroidales bacterium]